MNGLAFDIETTGKRLYHGAEMFSYATATLAGATEVHRLDRTAMRRAKAEATLRRIMFDTSVPLIGHNILFDLTGVMRSGYPMPWGRPIHDTILMSRILRNLAPSHALDDLCWEIGGWPRELDAAVAKIGHNGYHRVPENIMDEYQRADVARTMILFRLFWPEVKANPGFLDEYNTELALTWTTIRMIARGIHYKADASEKLIAKLEHDVEHTRGVIDQMVGRPINPLGEDMRRVLFDDLKLPVIKRTPKGKPSMDQEVFEAWSQDTTLQHPLLNQVLKYRSYTHSLPIIKGYGREADADGIIHPEIIVSQADTGREACKKPNLQNVQKEGVLTNRFPVPARNLFGPRPGNVWVLMDFAGQEALLLTHYSNDPEMLAIVNARGPGAIHDEAAAMIYLEQFTQCQDKGLKKSLRNAAKSNVSFALPYGSSDKGACVGLRLPPHIGSPRLRAFRARFPKYCGLTDTLKAGFRGCGYITTAFGRRLYIPHDKPYVLTNYLIQGTGAGMLKRAQVRVDEYLQDMTRGGAGIVLPVHDEIISEWPRELLGQLPKLLPDMTRIMTDFGNLFKVKFEVEVKIAASHWGNAKEVKVDAA